MESWVSLRSTDPDQIPAATLAVARAAFPKGSLAQYVTIDDQLHWRNLFSGSVLVMVDAVVSKFG